MEYCGKLQLLDLGLLEEIWPLLHARAYILHTRGGCRAGLSAPGALVARGVV